MSLYDIPLRTLTGEPTTLEAYQGKAGAILDHAAGHGLLLLQAGPDVLRFVPPLTITDEELTEGLQRLRQALIEFVGA